MKLELSLDGLERFRKETLWALERKYKIGALDYFRLQNVKLELSTEKRPENVWFGEAYYYENRIKVYNPNLSNQLIENAENCLRKEKVEDGIFKRILFDINSIPKEELFWIFNQSGMDHELAGHFYMFFSGSDCGEEIACDVQYNLAKLRAENDYWRKLVGLLPVVLEHHKGINPLVSILKIR